MTNAFEDLVPQESSGTQVQSVSQDPYADIPVNPQAQNTEASWSDRAWAMSGAAPVGFVSGLMGKEGIEQGAALNKGIAQGVREAGQEAGKIGLSSIDIFSKAVDPSGDSVAGSLGNMLRSSEYYRTLPKEIDKQRQEFEASIPDKQRLMSELGKFTGQAIPSFAAGAGAVRALGGVGKASGLGPMGANILEGTAQGIASGAATGALTPPQSADESKLEQIGMSAAIGGGIGAGLGAAAGKLSKLIKDPGKAESLVKTAKEKDIPLTVGQVTGRSGLQKTEETLSKLPLVGTNKIMSEQIEKLGQESRRIVEDIKSSASSATKINPKRESIIKGLSTANIAVSKKADSMFTEVIKKAGNEKLPMTDTLRQTMDVLDESGITTSKIGKALGSDIQKAASTLEQGGSVTFAEKHVLRKGLDDVIDSFTRKAAQGNVTKDQIRHITALRKTLEKEIEADASKLGVGDLYKKAKEFHQKIVLPFKEVDLENLASKPLPGMVKELQKLALTNREQVKTVINALPKINRNDISAGVMTNAMKNATSMDKGFSQSRFIKEISSSSELLGMTMTPSQSRAVQGLTKLSNAVLGTAKSSQEVKLGSGFVGAFGIALVSSVVPGGLAGAGAVAGSTAKLLSKALTSQSVIDSLVKLSKTSPGTASYNKAVSASLIAIGAAGQKGKKEDKK